ncbi:energy transducer TonB [Paraburkholderia jirisanensis]
MASISRKRIDEQQRSLCASCRVIRATNLPHRYRERGCTQPPDRCPVTRHVTVTPPGAWLGITRTVSGININCRFPAPAYPAGAREAHQAGTVWVPMRMSADGKPTRVVVARSSGNVALDEAAINAASRIQCGPPGRSIGFIQPIAFSLTQ